MLIKVKLCYVCVCQAKEVFDLTAKQHIQQSYNQRNITRTQLVYDQLNHFLC